MGVQRLGGIHNGLNHVVVIETIPRHQGQDGGHLAVAGHPAGGADNRGNLARQYFRFLFAFEVIIANGHVTETLSGIVRLDAGGGRLRIAAGTAAVVGCAPGAGVAMGSAQQLYGRGVKGNFQAVNGRS
jgi:hypothetical protein